MSGSEGINEDIIVECDEEDHPVYMAEANYTLNRMGAIAGKGPMLADFEPEMPDLSAYFAEFDIDSEAQIRICRTYATFLVAQNWYKHSNVKKRKSVGGGRISPDKTGNL